MKNTVLLVILTVLPGVLHSSPHHPHLHSHNQLTTSEEHNGRGHRRHPPPSSMAQHGRHKPRLWKYFMNSAEDEELPLNDQPAVRSHIDQPTDEPATTSGENDSRTSVMCPKCQSRPEVRVSVEELTELRIEYVKNQILQKLRLKDRPQVSMNNVPKPVADGVTIQLGSEQDGPSQKLDDFYAQTTQKIIFPKEDKEACSSLKDRSPSMCFSFQIPGDVSLHDVSDADLWVYKQKTTMDHHNTTFVVSDLAHWDSHRKFPKSQPLAIQETDVSEGWVKIDIVWAVKNWFKYHELTHVIQIACPLCDTNETDNIVSLDHDHKSFIVIYTHAQRKASRRRRSVNCSAGVSECCREKLYISFAEIGWNDWILHPPGYDAYFCRGSCSSAASIPLSATHYNSVLRKVAQQKSKLGTQNLELIPCCTATQFSSLQLFYMDSNNTATQKQLPNMVVESCGCM